MKNTEEAGRPGPFLTEVAVFGAAIFAAGLYWSPRQAWASLLLANFYCMGMSLFAPVFLSIQRLASARWHSPMRRLVCAMHAYLPVGAALTGLLLLGARRLYPWAAPQAAQDAYFRAHEPFFNLPFFALRAAAYLAAWHFAGRRMLRAGDRSKRPAAVFLLLFAVTFSLASVDWIMTLTPRWTSTIFPWYVFGGTFVGGFAALAVLLVWLRSRGLFSAVGKDSLHDLGKMVFAFSFFWGYLWLSQYLLIWYSNLPDETPFYLAQWAGPGEPLFWANVIVNFVLPFLLLLRASAKKNERLLLAAGLIILAGRWIDLYLLISPAFSGAGSALRFIGLELGVFAGVGALYLRRVTGALGPSTDHDAVVAAASCPAGNI